jgi:signal transduction histidine kinase
MTVRFKVTLFAAVAVGLTALMGGALFRLAQQGQHYLQQVVAVEEQGERCRQLKDGALEYARQLVHAHQARSDTQAVLARHEQHARMLFQELGGFWALDQSLRGGPPHPTEKALIDQLQQEHLHWMRGAEKLVRGATQEQQPALIGRTLDAFTQQVEPLLQQVWATEHARLEALQRTRLQTLRFHQRIGVLVPLLCVVLVLTLAAAILRPMHRSFQELVKGAARIGQGNFEHVVAVRDGGEFSTLAGALNHMAAQIRNSVLEKEQRARREAESLEQEMRRHNALLEETVRTRTAELENSNTQLKASLQRLKAVQDQLLFAERLATIGQIAAGIGHEINNPLSYILSNLNYTQEELRRTAGALSEQELREIQDALAEARDGAERVRLIVQDFKMMVRPDNIERGPVDLVPVVRTALKMAQHELSHRARVVIGVDSVPLVYGNAPRLGQVFLNLLINAAHAIPPGQVEQNTIKITARVSGTEHAIVEVSDTGCGIPPENVKRIFDPFFTTKPLGKGSGLGLSVSNSIIIAHGGEMSVESEVGKGTTFRLILPLHTGKPLPTPPPLTLIHSVSSEL